MGSRMELNSWDSITKSVYKKKEREDNILTLYEKIWLRQEEGEIKIKKSRPKQRQKFNFVGKDLASQINEDKEKQSRNRLRQKAEFPRRMMAK